MSKRIGRGIISPVTEKSNCSPSSHVSESIPSVFLRDTFLYQFYNIKKKQIFEEGSLLPGTNVKYSIKYFMIPMALWFVEQFCWDSFSQVYILRQHLKCVIDKDRLTWNKCKKKKTRACTVMSVKRTVNTQESTLQQKFSFCPWWCFSVSEGLASFLKSTLPGEPPYSWLISSSCLLLQNSIPLCRWTTGYLFICLVKSI